MCDATRVMQARVFAKLNNFLKYTFSVNHRILCMQGTEMYEICMKLAKKYHIMTHWSILYKDLFLYLEIDLHALNYKTAILDLISSLIVEQNPLKIISCFVPSFVPSFLETEHALRSCGSPWLFSLPCGRYASFKMAARKL